MQTSLNRYTTANTELGASNFSTTQAPSSRKAVTSHMPTTGFHLWGNTKSPIKISLTQNLELAQINCSLHTTSISTSHSIIPLRIKVPNNFILLSHIHKWDTKKLLHISRDELVPRTMVSYLLSKRSFSK